MKKRKFWVVLLAIAATFCMAFGLSACDGPEKEPEKEQADLWSMERVYATAQELGFKGTLEELIAMFKGEKGDPGQDGKDGKNGKDGISIQSVEIDENGHLRLTFSDGTVKDAGKITADGTAPAEEGTEGLQYQMRKDETGNEYVAVTGLGIAWDTDIVIPSTYRGLPVKEIGEQAFYIENSAFNATLTSVSIPNSVIKIGYEAFSGCSGLTSVTIGSGVTSIEWAAFKDCSGLTSITISSGVTSIGYEAFSGCSGLTEIKVDTNNQTYRSQDNCLIETKSKTLVLGCMTSKIPQDGSVTTIGAWAFEGCSGLTSVTIPDSVTSIERGAFYDCNGLTGELKIPDSVTSIGYWAFGYCSGFTSIIIPDSVTSIGEWAFAFCSRLTSIDIPNSVTEIRYRAFEGCSGLKEVRFANPNRWKVSLLDDMPYDLAVSGLEDPATAAYCLTDAYCGYYWKREG